MGSDLPKQFLSLNGRPILIRTIELFESLQIPVAIFVVLPLLYLDFWRELILEHKMLTPHKVIAGGITRFHSVQNALIHIEDGEITAVHDGVRPLVSNQMILNMLKESDKHPAVIPGLEINDSMRLLNQNETTDGAYGSTAVDRSCYRLVQTPQIFWTNTLKQAYQQCFLPSFSDDATVVEHLGIPLFFIKGEPKNLKITTPDDLKVAELLASFFVHSAVLDPDLPLNSLVKRD